MLMYHSQFGESLCDPLLSPPSSFSPFVILCKTWPRGHMRPWQLHVNTGSLNEHNLAHQPSTLEIAGIKVMKRIGPSWTNLNLTQNYTICAAIVIYPNTQQCLFTHGAALLPMLPAIGIIWSVLDRAVGKQHKPRVSISQLKRKRSMHFFLHFVVLYYSHAACVTAHLFTSCHYI